MIERRPLRAAYLQCFPTDEVLAQMAAGQAPQPGTGAVNGTAAPGRQAPAAPITDPQGSLRAAAKVRCSSSQSC